MTFQAGASRIYVHQIRTGHCRNAAAFCHCKIMLKSGRQFAPTVDISQWGCEDFIFEGERNPYMREYQLIEKKNMIESKSRSVRETFRILIKIQQ